MVSKRKKPQVAKARSATPAPPKSPKPPEKKVDSRPSPEVLIIQNGTLIEELFKSKPWTEIALPLIQEMIASVSGRFTSGRYYHGSLTTKWQGTDSVFYAAYQKAIMDLYNNLNDFVLAKNKLIENQKAAKLEKDAPLYNPFMEGSDAET